MTVFFGIKKKLIEVEIENNFEIAGIFGESFVS